MQPYFLPYGGYFSLLYSADIIVFLDTDQYVKRRWMNRCRVIEENRENWLTIPVKSHAQTEKIQNIKIASGTNEFLKAVRKIERIKSSWANSLDNLLTVGTENLSESNINLLAGIFKILFREELSYHMLSDLDVPEFEGFQQRAIWLTKEFGCSTYLNATSGAGLYHQEAFLESGLDLSFMPVYSRTQNDTLSVICEPNEEALRTKIIDRSFL